MDIKFSVDVSGRAYVEHLSQPRTKIELTKGARGMYRWTVEVSDPVARRALQTAQAMECALAKEYGQKEEAGAAE